MKAFPITSKHEENNGMDLRDYFAAKALQGIMANSEFGPEEADDVAVVCYMMASSMVKLRDELREEEA